MGSPCAAYPPAVRGSQAPSPCRTHSPPALGLMREGSTCRVPDHSDGCQAASPLGKWIHWLQGFCLGMLPGGSCRLGCESARRSLRQPRGKTWWCQGPRRWHRGTGALLGWGSCHRPATERSWAGTPPSQHHCRPYPLPQRWSAKAFTPQLPLCATGLCQGRCSCCTRQGKAPEPSPEWVP